MESIDKLRRYFNRRAKGLPYDIKAAVIAVTVDDVFAMLDEIERDVAELTDERDLLKTQWEAGVDFDQRLEVCADNREDVTLFGVDYTPLPVDADGVPIHAGDVLDGYGKTIDVVEMRHGRSGWVLISRDGNAYADCAAFSHHYATTVEDVLREFAERWDDPAHYAKGELVETFAARLRLAGDE